MPTWPTITPAVGAALSFLEIQGDPDLPTKEVNAVLHKGVDGALYQRLAKRPEDWELTTIVDCDNDGGAKDVVATLRAYKALVGTIVTLATLRETAATKVVVMGVAKVNVHKLVQASEGVSTNRTRLLTCRWRMQNADLT